MSTALATTFDPNAVGDEIKSHLEQAKKLIEVPEEAKKAHDEHIKAAAALLFDVQQNHPEALEAMCKRIGVKKSRRDELLAIGGGRKTLEDSRARNKARQDRKREKEAAALAKANAEKSGEAQANDPLQPDVTGDAADENEPAPSLDPAQLSARALKEFKVAADKYLPDIDASEQHLALEYVSEMIKQRRAA